MSSEDEEDDVKGWDREVRSIKLSDQKWRRKWNSRSRSAGIQVRNEGGDLVRLI